MNERGTVDRAYRKASWTADQSATLDAIGDRLEAENRPDAGLASSGALAGPIPLGVYHAFMQSLHRLKQIREAQGLSLTDVENRSGLTRSAISRLENGQNSNPTMTTVLRYATALGKKVKLSFEDQVSA